MEFYTNVYRYGKNILYRGVKDGKRVHGKAAFSPTMFVKDTSLVGSDWKSLNGDCLKPIKFSCMHDAKEFIQQYEDVHGFDIFGMEKFEYQYLIEHFPNEVKYNLNQMNIVIVDIETTVERGEIDVKNTPETILLISLQRKSDKRVVTFGLGPYSGYSRDDYPADVSYYQFKDEASLLKAFVQYWSGNYPDIVSGWNTDFFDMPYLANRINKVLGEDWLKRLSPWGLVRQKTVTIKGEDVDVWDFVGITQLDYLVLYKKFSFTPQESYSLDNVSYEELGAKKLKHNGSFKDFYTNHWDDFVTYNIRDCQLVDLMDSKFKFIELCIQIAYMAKCNIQDVFSPVKTWDVFIYSQLHTRKIAIPKYKDRVGGTIEGAYVKDPKVGMYGWNVSFDFAALYPSIIRQWNMSPETMVEERFHLVVSDFVNQTDAFLEAAEYAKANGYTLAANGTMYRKDHKGIIPQLMEYCLVGRKVAKNEMLSLEQKYNDTKDESLVPVIAALDGKQMALKILANSGYGAMANVGFRYFCLAMAEAITLTGQASNMHLEKSFNVYFTNLIGVDEDYVIYCDTDSNYVNLGRFVDKFCSGKSEDQIVDFLRKCDPQFQKIINKSVSTVYDMCNCYDKVMSSKREAISSKGFWTAKKRYALKVHDSEGVSYNPPKIKVTGLDLVKTSTPSAIRKKLKDSLNIIFDHGEIKLREYVSGVKTEFTRMNPEDVAFPRGVSDIDKWVEHNGSFKRGCPIHVRAALVYNKALNGKGLEDKHHRLSNGDKLRFIYLKLPNPLRENVVGFPATDILPDEFGVHSYIDWELQFDKVFMSPMRGITDAIGWTLEERSSLDEFFG